LRKLKQTTLSKKITSALISVFDKDGLDNIIPLLDKHNIHVYSTGGTYKFLEGKIKHLTKVEDITGYPSILGGRVKTLHPAVFGGILAMRTDDHLAEIKKFNIPELDLVVVDLYPFEKTVASSDDEGTIIEKIDIGGISLIRAAAKNFKDVVVIPSKDQYADLEKILSEDAAITSKEQRKKLASQAFDISSHYDTAIFNYMAKDDEDVKPLKISFKDPKVLRYGENPHQQGIYFGEMNAMFNKRTGKALSFNNLVDVDAAVQLMAEFENEKCTFAILKHTNACGLATRPTVMEAWTDALAGDPISAFGGILICNSPIDLDTAKEIDKIFYEVLIAPSFDQAAYDLLSKKEKRVLMEINHYQRQPKSIKSILNGVIVQDTDMKVDESSNMSVVTKSSPSEAQLTDLEFASKLAKHLKSNTIVLARNKQLLGMGCGQTSRVDACNQAIDKAKRMGFDLTGCVMASDAFFPFPDCVELGHNAGVAAVIQPGGSIKDKKSIEYCDNNNLPMVFTGTRHFKH